MENDNGMLIVSPSEIDEYIKNETNGIQNERDFVCKVKDYINGNYHRALLVTGLRSTGKTVGILQGIRGKKALYISPIARGTAFDLPRFKKLLEDCQPEVTVIDEFSWIKFSDIKKDDTEKHLEFENYLAGITKIGSKVIISGTDSAVINGLKNTEFVHRAIEIHTTVFTYDKYCRIYDLPKNNETMRNFLENGGVFEAHIKESIGSMRQYIQNAIIDNLASYYPEYDKELIKAHIYTIFYNCVCNLFNNDGKEIPVYNYGAERQSYEEFLEDFGINPATKIDTRMLRELSDKLSEIDVVFTLDDLRINNHKRAYITNPTITYQMTKCIYNLDTLDDSYLGFLYEASVVCSEYMRHIKEAR